MQNFVAFSEYMNLLWIFLLICLKWHCWEKIIDLNQSLWTIFIKNDNFIQIDCNTGKSFSEALILASTNTQYDKILFIQLQDQYMKIASSEHVKNMLSTQIVFCFYIHNNLCTWNFLEMFLRCSWDVLSLEFSCTELVIQWTIFCHIVG